MIYHDLGQVMDSVPFPVIVSEHNVNNNKNREFLNILMFCFEVSHRLQLV